MVTKKNIFHYLVYVLFALTFICSVGLYAVKYVEYTGGSDYIIPLILKYCIVLVGTLVLIFGYRIAIKYIPEKYIPQKTPVIPRMYELIALVLCVILAIFIRFMSVANVLGHDIESVFYNYAKGLPTEIPSSFAAYIYANICTFFYGVIEGPYLIYAFNGILQIASIVLLYFFVKRAFQMRYAIAVCVLLSFLPACFSTITVISSDHFVSFLVILFMYFLGRICELNRKGKLVENYQIVFIILLGAYAGIMSAMDILGCAAIISGVAILLMVRNKEPWQNIQKNWFQALVFFASAIAALLLFLYFVPIDSVKGIEGIVNYFYGYIPSGLSLIIVVPMYKRPESIALYVLVQIAILAFIRDDDDYGLIFVIFADVASIFTFVVFNSSDYSVLVDTMYICLAAIGMFSIPKFVLTKEEIESNAEKKKSREKQKEKRQIEREKKDGTLRLSLNPDNDEEENESGFKSVSLDNKEKEKPEPQVVSAPPQIPKELVEENKETAGEVVKKESKPLIPKEEVIPEPSEVKRNVIPSRREYKTAHVYKSEEEKAIHDSKLNEPVVTSVKTDANLKEKPAAVVNKTEGPSETPKLIKNVLPMPKPHVSKELSFDYNPTAGEMDYDIIDLKGKDFYDI